MSEELKRGSRVQMAPTIGAAHVSKSSVPAADIPRLISDIYQALSGLAGGRPPATARRADPAGPGEKNITPHPNIFPVGGGQQKKLKRRNRTTFRVPPPQDH